MQVKRGGDHRRESNDGPCALAGIDFTEIQCIKYLRISEGEKCADDI